MRGFIFIVPRMSVVVATVPRSTGIASLILVPQTYHLSRCLCEPHTTAQLPVLREPGDTT